MGIFFDEVKGTLSTCDKPINANEIYFVKPPTKRPLG
jgi:hypothetical protein